jgi:cell division septation protein DedD
MAEPRDSGRQEDAILKLMVEFRQIWPAHEASRPGSFVPPPLTPTKHGRLWVLIPLLAAAVASAYFAQLLEHPSDLSLHVPWASSGQTATRPVGNGTLPPTPLLSAAGQEAGASKPSPPPIMQGGPRPAVAVDSAALGISAPRPEQPLGYHVQAGAFNIGAYAHDLIRQLGSHGYPAMVVDAPTGPPHRVWIKGIFDRPDAERLVSRLRKDGFEAILLPQ